MPEYPTDAVTLPFTARLATRSQDVQTQRYFNSKWTGA